MAERKSTPDGRSLALVEAVGLALGKLADVDAHISFDSTAATLLTGAMTGLSRALDDFQAAFDGDEHEYGDGQIMHGLQLLARAAQDPHEHPRSTSATQAAQRYVRVLLRMDAIEYQPTVESVETFHGESVFRAPPRGGGAPWTLTKAFPVAPSSGDGKVAWHLLWQRPTEGDSP